MNFTTEAKSTQRFVRINLSSTKILHVIVCRSDFSREKADPGHAIRVGILAEAIGYLNIVGTGNIIRG